MLSARRLVQPAGNRHSTCVNQHAVEVLLQSQATAPGSKHWCRVMRVVARRSAAYASNSHIFLAWMLGTSLVLMTVAVLFLRNQMRPILALAEAAESFGTGRPMPEHFRPRGHALIAQPANRLPVFEQERHLV
jgi:hypothetical protein